MRFKAAEWKCWEEKKLKQSRKQRSPSEKKDPSTHILHFCPFPPHFLYLYCITGSCSTYKILHIKINNVSFVVIKYISVLDLSPF